MNITLDLTTLIFVILVFWIHWFADFIMQDEEWAVTKSYDNHNLLLHTYTYSGMWFIAGLIYSFPAFWSELNSQDYFELMIKFVFVFPLITFITHTITDYFTSKETSKLYKNKKFGSSIPNLGFFSMIGFDQCLHYTQLFVTYYILTII